MREPRETKGNEREKHMKGVDECSLPARTNGLVIDTHEGWMVLYVCHSWVDCQQDEPLLECQRVEPVAVREAIHRFSIFTPSKAYQSASTDARGAPQTGVSIKARATEGGLGERKE
jgi:hypothetical protein